MNPVLRKTLSVLVIVAGLLFLVPLVEYCLSEKPTPEFTGLNYQPIALVYLTISMIGPFTGILLQPVCAKRWRWICFGLCTGAWVCAIIIGHIVAWAGLILVIMFAVANCWPRLRIIFLLAGCLMPTMLYLVAIYALYSSAMSACSQVGANLHSLAFAIEAYKADHGTYPACTSKGPYAFWRSHAKMPSFAGNALAGLTTPVAYLERYEEDPFEVMSDHRTFAYYCNGPSWIIFSSGPNHRFEIPADRLAIILEGKRQPSDELLNYTYDTTNGIRSAGDIWRMNQ